MIAVSGVTATTPNPGRNSWAGWGRYPNVWETLRGGSRRKTSSLLWGSCPTTVPRGPRVRFEFIQQAPSSMRETIRACVNSSLTGEAPPPLSWMGGLVCFLLNKEDVLYTAGYRPVCLLDTVYKVVSAIVTDRLYRLGWASEATLVARSLTRGVPPATLHAAAAA
jgi:hypothetical protein